MSGGHSLPHPARPDLRPSSWLPAALAVLAYLPTLTAAPGRMPADSKLFLYLDPGRLIADAPYSWDTRQFGGWVPHQTMSYLWPSGPWFWLLDRLGVPDWVAHRLWIGTLLFLGGLGVRWAARHLGFGAVAALVAGAVYQLSPYVLPYISRTSVLLLPWAGVGWITGLTILATRRPARIAGRRQRPTLRSPIPSRPGAAPAASAGWREPAIIALIVLSVGAVNVTALVLIAPAPALWLIHAVWQHELPWRRALGIALRIGGASAVVSLWWVVMLLVQRRYGADVLSFSETLADVSRTATGTETLRGLGYWLFYVHDPVAPTTTAAGDYMSSSRVIIAGFALLVVGLAGIALVRWSARRFAALLVFTGVIIGVGAHPLDHPAPLWRPVSGSGLLLALRSTTRALPLSCFGLALGAGALVSAAGAVHVRRQALTPGRRRMLGAAVVVGLAVINLPALFDGGYVDAALQRDERPPAAWRDAAHALDRGSPEERVLQLPGQEFGAFRWGYTVDPPLVGMTDRPLLTRDLLPLGSPGVMDLLFALDDRFQDGTIDPAAIAPVARLLAADTIWSSNDTAFERFRTERPELAAAVFAAQPVGLRAPLPFGVPQVDVPAVPMLDETALARREVGSALPPVQLVAVDDPVPVLRVGSRTVVLAGSGDGIVDAAGAGLLHGDEAVLYAADAISAAPVDPPALLVITDSNRDRAHHWRGSQDVVGFTESGGPVDDVLRDDPSDQRLAVFAPGSAGARSTEQTTASLAGDLRIRASAYGEPFAYRPEDRAAMAVDGDPATAWVVGDRADPVGEQLEVTGAGNGPLMLLQPQDTWAARMITGVQVERLGGDGASASDVALETSSLLAPGQSVPVPAGSGPLRITITAVADRPGGTDSGPSAVGFAELGLGAHPEVVRVPTAVISRFPPATPLALVFRRLRIDPLDRWRSDPEPVLRRRFDLPQAISAAASFTLRLAPRADDEVLAALTTPEPAAVADRRLTGDPGSTGWHAVDGDPSTAWTSPFGDAVGARLDVALDPAVPIDSLHVQQPVDDRHSTITALHLDVDGHALDVELPAPDPAGISTVPVPSLLGARLQLTVTAISPRRTIDRRYGERTALPVSIDELTGITLATAASGEAGHPSCRSDLVTLDGAPLPLAVGDGTVDDLLAGRAVTVTPCDPRPLALSSGTHLLESANGASTGIEVDGVVVTAGTPAAGTPTAGPPAPEVTVTRTRTSRTAHVAACPDGCWLIFGEGLNRGWRATSAGAALGAPTQVSGGFNGWWLPPSNQARTVTLRWTPQRANTIGLIATVVAALGCLALVGRGRWRSTVDPPRPDLTFAGGGPASRRCAVAAAVVLVAGATLLASPLTGLVALAVAAVVVMLRRPLLAGAAAAALATALGVIVLWRERVHRYPADTSWPAHFADLHTVGVLVVVLLLAGSLSGTAEDRPDAAQPAR